MTTVRPSPRRTILILPHTHWDREWYLPYERFRRALVEVIDRLLSIMRADPTYERFTLDGQSIVLDDYLAMRPEQEPLIRELVAQGRLAIGPWYVLPDEFLVSGEALVRNLLFGRARAARHGRPMAVGYLPDTFGHIAQLPQILRGFGIASAVFARGVGDEGETLGSEFFWEALDGSRILAVHQVRGYCNAAALGYPVPAALFDGGPADPALAADRVHREVARLVPYSRAGVILLNNGCDHQPPSPDLPRLIGHLRQTMPSFDIRWATPPEVADEILARQPALSTWRGELRGSRYAPLIPGVLSTRIYLKQANEAAQTLLELWAEPLATLAWAVGGPHPGPFLRHAWELLLQNHPHDSICGCSVDLVHREMLTRFARVEAIGTEIADRALAEIAHRVASDAVPEGLPLAVFNPLNWPRSEVVRCSLSLPAAWASRLSVRDGGGHQVPFQILRRFRQVLTRERLPADDPPQRLWWLSHEVEAAWGARLAAFRLRKNTLVIEAADPAACPPGVLNLMADVLRRRDSGAGLTAQVERSVVELALLATDVPPVGYTTLVVANGDAGPQGAPDEVRVAKRTLENGSVAVEVGGDGTVMMRDKTTGGLFQGHVLEDRGDAGDQYDYSPIDEPPVLTDGLQGRIEMVHAGPLVGTLRVHLPLRLPERMSPDRRRRIRRRVTCPVTVDITVTAGSPAVEFTTILENRAQDHRLRVLFPTGIRAAQSVADTQFAVVERPVTRPAGEGWAQPPQPTAPHQSWVGVSDGRHGLAVFSSGLPEHEVIPEEGGLTVALTLLRCVGWLSRDDLRTRAGHAGPGYATPEAQCPGVHRFRYALLAHAGGWEHASLVARGLGWRVPMRAVPTSRHAGPLPSARTFLACEGAVLSAITPAASDDGVLIRAYNPTPAERQAVIRTTLPYREAREVTLAEEDVGGIPSRDGGIELAMKPFQIRTIKLVLP